MGVMSRMGRALSESEYSNDIELNMLHMISDNGLDDYNRLLVYYLFVSYNNYIEDPYRQKINWDKLQNSLLDFPKYLSTRFKN